jgi:hypothetical protein
MFCTFELKMAALASVAILKVEGRLSTNQPSVTQYYRIALGWD